MWHFSRFPKFSHIAMHGGRVWSPTTIDAFFEKYNFRRFRGFWGISRNLIYRKLAEIYRDTDCRLKRRHQCRFVKIVSSSFPFTKFVALGGALRYVRAGVLNRYRVCPAIAMHANVQFNEFIAGLWWPGGIARPGGCVQLRSPNVQFNGFIVIQSYVAKYRVTTSFLLNRIENRFSWIYDLYQTICVSPTYVTKCK